MLAIIGMLLAEISSLNIAPSYKVFVVCVFLIEKEHLAPDASITYIK